ncbi:MAG: hypothetical protein J6U54_01590 [Clostridiales bacterium]|nr:hypothetical protein [Clostridiales bacterium]
MNENENMNNVVENEQIENTGLTTGEKVTVGAIGAAAVVGLVTLGKFAYDGGKKGIGWIKAKIKDRKKETVVEEAPVEEQKNEEVGA